MYNSRANSFNLGLALRLSQDVLSVIKKECAGDAKAHLRDVVAHWLQRNYNTERFGHPSWRMLADAVANSAGGTDRLLALKIAEKHKGRSVVLYSANLM